MFKQEPSASRVTRIWRVATLRSTVETPAFGLDTQSAWYIRPGKVGRASTYLKAASTLFTSRRESVGNAGCSS